MLTVPVSTVCYIIIKAREFSVKVEPVEENPGSNPSDDREVDILEDYGDDPTYQELRAALVSLNDDEKLDLMALTWIGRGDYAVADWAEARLAAAAMRTKHIPSYLIGTPLLSDFLEEGLSELGLSCADIEMNHL